MMNFDAIINNPSIMGVLGVILGAMIGGIINCVINKQNHGFQKERDRIEKVEETAIDFLLLMQKISTYNLMVLSNTDRSRIRKQDEEIMALNEQVKAKMQFYFEIDEYNIAMEICQMVDSKAEEEAAAFNKTRREKVNLLINKVNKRIKKQTFNC